MKIGSYSCPRR